MAKILGLSSLDLRNILPELKQLEGGRLNKLYQLKERFTFRIAAKTGQFNLNIVLPGLIFVSETVKFAETSAGNFSMSLRKRLDNALLKSVEQVGTERILKLVFEKGETFVVLVELFSRGNLLLLDSQERILSIYSTQSWSTRELKRGLHYEMPPAMPSFDVSEREIAGVLKFATQENIVKFLAVGLGLGGIYSEETCLIGEIDKTKSPADVTPRELSKALGVLLHKDISPTLYIKNGPFAFSSYQLKSLESLKFQGYPTISRMVEAYLDLADTAQPSVNSSTAIRLQGIIAKQEVHIIELEREAAESSRRGELVYENYQKISTLIQGFEEVRTTKGAETAFEWLQSQPGVVSINKKEFSFAVEL